MPTLFRRGPYRFYIFSSDGAEPKHVQRDEARVKFWLATVQLSKSDGFTPRELRHFNSVVRNHREDLIEAWDDFFGL